VNVAALLDRLDGLRQTGPDRWIARCPAHDDRSPSLSVRILDDGRILLHDFGGCEVESVVGALGMSVSDLFPDKPLTETHLPRARSRIPASDILVALDHEAAVVAIIASDILDHREIDEATWTRLAAAVAKVGEARAAAAPARVSR